MTPNKERKKRKKKSDKRNLDHPCGGWSNAPKIRNVKEITPQVTDIHTKCFKFKVNMSDS